MDKKADLTKLWRTIKGIYGRAKHTAVNEAITYNGISFSSSKQLAAKFNQQFNTSNLGRHTFSSKTRLVTRETKRKPMDMAQSFTTDHGPDKLSIVHLNNLEPRAIEYITALFNLSVTTSDYGYMEVMINHPYTEDWQKHLPRIFISAYLASQTSSEVLETLILPTINTCKC